MSKGLVLTRKTGQSIHIGDQITVTVTSIIPNREVCLTIVAPANHQISASGSRERSICHASIYRLPGQYVEIGDQIMVTIDEVNSGEVRLRTCAPREVSIIRAGATDV